ncbi:hypothetical protein [Amycolatopsis taiwanensis]|uniref:Uncharacterized protein n=1 Tax=Amycolatopsis taiwanensis TaxID=342230 RepID=A0A9W6VE12_9PSEU|nr:hypothetical protein [Amycolatopsis taiwanensis]GLY67943.1 hypothetical protein Atai01_45620 [Amycolatopsis taiwanensis]
MSGAEKLLAIYLNDHLAGATVGRELARRVANTWSEQHGEQLRRIAEEIAEDRTSLVTIMRRLGVRLDPLKPALGWLGEKVGRLKLNGRLFTRSPLSPVLELEAMRLGVEGKAAGWRTLRSRAEHDNRLSTVELDGLIARAAKQIDTLERLRVESASALM